MKIVDVVADPLVYPLARPFWNGRAAISSAEGGRIHRARGAVLVRVRTDEGLVGIGEAGLAGAPVATVAGAVVHHLKPLLIGEDPLDIERLWRKGWESAGASGRRGVMMLALSGVDIALWDLAGKALGVPIHRLLGTFRARVPAYASAGFYTEGKDVSALAAEMASYVEQGFKAVKMKVGAQSRREDAARVHAVRSAVGADVRLMVDANSVYAPKEAIAFARAVEDCDLAWFEEPVRADNVEGSAQVARAIDAPVAGYETEFSLYGYRELVTRGAVDVVQTDITWAGGITECRRIAALAAAYDLPCTTHAFSSAITVAVSLQLLAALPNGGPLELDRTDNALREQLITQPFAVEADGCVAVPEEPGLGVELDEGIVARYRVDV
ncbi:MAG: mandelate racemase/muconate lactonizing enzyme family protein [Chloroflexota bacterium]